MKTPPFLLFAALLFWGWQSHLLWEGAAAGAVLEAARVARLRWDLEDVDFNRLWSLCVLVMMVTFGYLFTTNDQGGGFAAMTHGPGAIRNVQNATSSAAYSVLRWLPLICLPFMAAQAYNTRPSVPLTAVSMVLRIRRRRGEHSLAGRYLDVSYAYFIFCLFSAGEHGSQGTLAGTFTYFLGQFVLIGWALWALRSGRFGAMAWAAALMAVILAGLLGLVSVLGAARVMQNLDAKLLSRLMRSRTDSFRSATALGQIGELKLSRRIVIRLEPKQAGVAPDYLREASYRIFRERDQDWLAGSAGNDFSALQPQADNTTWLLLSNKVGAASVNIACYLDGRSRDTGDPQGVLPIPSGCCSLYNLPYLISAIAVETNKTGVVLVTGLGLMIFDARYGPGATIDSPPDTSTNQFDVKVPDEETNALARVIGEMNIPGGSDLDKRLAVQTFFGHKFSYSTWQGPEKRSPTNTPLTRFLLASRSGHCEYFAAATVLLLRQLGIPARYAVGYYVHETSGTGYVVRESDAHAWCLAWNRQTRTWEDFDTTPPSWVSVEERNASFFDAFTDLRSWLVFQFERFRWRQANLRQYILWSLSPVIAVLLYYIIFQRRAKARAAAKKAAAEAPVIWPGHDSAFYRLERALAARGLPRQPQEALADWLERALAEPALAELRAPLRELLRLHYRYRFDPLGLSDDEKMSLVKNAGVVLGKLTAVLKPPQSRR